MGGVLSGDKRGRGLIAASKGTDGMAATVPAMALRLGRSELHQRITCMLLFSSPRSETLTSAWAPIEIDEDSCPCEL